VLSISLGFVVGTLCAVARVYGGRPLRLLVGGYVELIRNTPLLVQIFIVYFGLSSLGLKLSAEVSAVIALVVNMGAYTTEIMRAGIQSIHHTQLEAADCLGLTRLQTILHVVLLPAIERVYPALSSQFVLLMLASSITSQISAEELTAVANNVQSDTYRSFEVYIVVAVIYLALSLLYRLAFKAVGLVIFARRRRLGTAL
jgi:polar amino acid transport system permease protein